MEPQPSLASGKINNQNISAWAEILIIKLVLFRVCSAAAAQPASASNWQVSTYSSSASLAHLIWLRMGHSLNAELGLLICEWMLSKLVGHKMLTLLTWRLDLMYMYRANWPYWIGCAFALPTLPWTNWFRTSTQRLTKLRAVAAPGGYFSLDSETLIVKDFLIFFQFWV